MRHAHVRAGARRRALVLAAVTAVIGGALVVVPATTSSAAGTVLVNETFTGTSAADPKIKPLGDACLTKATTAPPVGASALGVCGANTNGKPSTSDPGWMLLTGTNNNRSGGIVYNQALPASAGVEITFDQAQYGGSSADGISFFLSDGTYDLATTGATGGSLGYAQKIGTASDDGPGVVGGFLGLALDAWGNFPRSNEGRGTGCAAVGKDPGNSTATDRIANSVTLRGPGWQAGDGAWTQGYCLVATNQLSSTTQNLRGADAENGFRTVRIKVYPTATDGSTRITVEVNFDPAGAGAFQTVLDTTTTDPVPSTYKFGFAASTGGATDVHLIRNLAVTTIDALPALSLAKAVDTTSPLAKAKYAEGDQVPYTFTLTNGTSFPIDPVAVTDPLVTSITCPDTRLAAAGSLGSTMTCTGTHTVTAAEAGNPTLTNTATASGTSNGSTVTSDPSSATVDLVTPDARYDFTKTATWNDVNGNGLHDAGDTVSYQFSVHNTGNVTLAPVTITDAKLGLTDWQCLASIAPGATQTCNAPAAYTVKESDVIHGSVDNSATATAKRSGSNDPITRTGDATVPTDPASVSITHVKKATVTTPAGDPRTGPAHVGDKISYSFTVKNTGNVTIPTVTINDPGLGVSALECATDLAPGAEKTCTTSVTHTVSEADLVAGKATNTAVATVTPPTGVTAPPPVPSTVDTPTETASAQITLDKTATLDDANHNGGADAGEVITYGFTVTNVGNVTVHDVALTDPKFSGLTCTPTTLAPGADATCSQKTYTVVEADILHGSVDNTATASAKAPTGVPNPADATDTADVPTAAAAPKVALTKHATLSTDANGNGLGDPGDVVSYSFEITNVGNVSLHDFTVHDSLLGGAIACLSGETLAPGQSKTCSPSQTHTITQHDLVANKADHLLHNTATVDGTTPGGGTTTSEDSSTTTPLAPANPALTVDKKHTLSTDVDGDGQADPGDTVSYSFVVTNVGNLTLTDVKVTDPKLGVSIDCAATLEPGEHATCTSGDAIHVITEADVIAGSYSNTAKATGDSEDGPTPPAEDTDVVTPVPPHAAFTLVKHAKLADTDKNGKADTGEKITYSFTVTNTGNVTLPKVTVTDDLLGVKDLACATDLKPGASLTCEAPEPYTVTDEDMVAGKVANTATGAGTPPPGVTPPSKPTSSTTTVTSKAEPALSLVKKGALKDKNGDGKAQAGEKIAYTFTVTNSGNVTLRDVTVVDKKIGKVTCPAGELAPGASVTCRGAEAYTVTAADVKAGKVVNVAVAKAAGPGDTGSVSSSESSATTATSEDPSDGGTLPWTGVDVRSALGLGLLLLAAGAALVVLRRRRQA